MTLRLRRRGSRLFSMNEGRKSQIVLLDERRLDIIIQPKLYASELLDLVASHFKLKEKIYFGLGFIDETNHFSWLQKEKRVLDHDLPKKTGHLLLYFSIKFYVETIGLLRDTQTVELFYLNARKTIFRGPIECDSEIVFELAAHVLQASNGDFVSEEETREELKKLPLIPTRTLKEHPSISFCEDRVICYYEKLAGTSRGLAIVNYMSIVEKLQTYGIHYYDVKDKKDIPWWLGISLKGIAVYDRNDKNTPRKLFRWNNIENLYCRDRKFTIEVHSPKREEGGNLVSVSRRTFGGSNVDVHAWFCVNNSLTRCIWSMAVAQHLFDVECRQKKGNMSFIRNMSDLASELCRSTTSLPGSMGSDLSRSPSSQSLSNSRYDLTIEQSDSLKAEREMYQALKARKEALEETLRKKTEELKRICFEEGELTGELPTDTPLAPGEQPPTFRRRVGTAFSLSVKDKDVDPSSTELSKVELEVELQGKITSAAHRLASDKTVSKYVRKQRRQSYLRSLTKLKEMEKKLGDMRRQAGKPVSSHTKGRVKEGTYHDDDSVAELDPVFVDLAHRDLNPNRMGSDSCGNSIHSDDFSFDSSSSASLGVGGEGTSSVRDSSFKVSKKEKEEDEGSVNYVFHSCASSAKLRLSSSSPLSPPARGKLSTSSSLSYSITDVSQRLNSLVESTVISTNEEIEALDVDDAGLDDEVITQKEKANRSWHPVGSRYGHRRHYSANRVSGTLHEMRKHLTPSPHELRKSKSLGKQSMRRRISNTNENGLGYDSGSSEEEEEDDDVNLRERRGRHKHLELGQTQSNRERSIRPEHLDVRQTHSNTLVERRRKMFIAGRSLRRSRESEKLKSMCINEGYKAFERICLGFAEDDKNSGRKECYSQPVSPITPDSDFSPKFMPFSLNEPETLKTHSCLPFGKDKPKSPSSVKLDWPRSDSQSSKAEKLPSPASSPTSKENAKNAFQFWTRQRDKPSKVKHHHGDDDKSHTDGFIRPSASSSHRNDNLDHVPVFRTVSTSQPPSPCPSRSKVEHWSDSRRKMSHSGICSDIRRFNSHSTALGTAPVALEEEDLEEHNNKDYCHVVLRRRVQTADDTIYPLRRRSSCPSIGAQLSVSGKGIETLV